MYDEFLKRLWECASGECFNCSQYKPTTNASVCQKELMKQAADAIEYLQKEVAFEEALAKCWEGHAEDCRARFQKLLDARPKWISVEERLPENQQFVLAWKDEKPKGFACICLWTDKTGWAFKNITHWMPLPEPPKEET